MSEQLSEDLHKMRELLSRDGLSSVARALYGDKAEVSRVLFNTGEATLMVRPNRSPWKRWKFLIGRRRSEHRAMKSFQFGFDMAWLMVRMIEDHHQDVSCTDEDGSVEEGILLTAPYIIPGAQQHYAEMLASTVLVDEKGEPAPEGEWLTSERLSRFAGADEA